MRKLLVLLVVLAVFFGARALFFKDAGPLVGGPQKLTNEYAKSSPRYATQQAFIDKVNADPRILALFAGGSEEAVYRAWTDALASGAQTLPGDRLVEVAKTQVAIMARLPEASCAKLVRPRTTFDVALGNDVKAAVEELPIRHHEVMTRYIYDALLANVEKAPKVPIDEQQLKYAFESLGERYPGQFGERLARVVNDPGNASDEDACWAANSMLHTATELSDETAEALLRKVLAG